MRYTTVILSWNQNQLHPIDETVAAATEVQFEASHYINPIDDGAYVELVQFSGNTDTLEEILRKESSVLEYGLSDDGTGLVYIHFESTSLFDALLDAILEHTVVLQWPVEFVKAPNSRGIQITLLGSEDALEEAIEALPTEINVSLIRTGDYTDSLTGPLQALSDKQKILLEEALQAGYYEVPRTTTQEELAEKLDITHGTLSERLRRIESTLIKSIAPRLHVPE